MFITWRYQRFHLSYLLGWLSVGILAGLLLGKDLVLGNNAPILFIGLLFILGALRSRRWWAVPAIIVAGLCFGALQGQSVGQAYAKYQFLYDKPVTIEGTMSGDAQVKGSQQRLVLAHVIINARPYPGEVFVSTYGKKQLKRGDVIIVEGRLREGFASYAAALSSAKIIAAKRTPDIVQDIREQFSKTIRSLVLEPMASLGLGFVVGQRSTLPDDLDEKLKVVGLTHIVVASGYNLTILVRFVMRLLARHSRYLALSGSLLTITAFVLFSGLSPSMNRAVIVTVLGLLAWYVGRRFHPVLLLIYVAAVTAFFNPMYVWADLGWYLSFFAFGGILIVAPLVAHSLYRRREPSSFEQLVLETLSAELMALPLIAFAFATVPVFGLVANVLVAPFIPAAMALTALTGIIGMVSLSLANIIALPTTVLIGYMIAVVEWLAELPMAQLSFDVGLYMIIGWYLAILAGCAYMKRKSHYDFRARDPMLEV